MAPDDHELKVAKSLTDLEIAVALLYTAPKAKTDIMKAILVEAARRLGGPDIEFVEPSTPPPQNPPLQAYAEMVA